MNKGEQRKGEKGVISQPREEGGRMEGRGDEKKYRRAEGQQRGLDQAVIANAC